MHPSQRPAPNRARFLPWVVSGGLLVVVAVVYGQTLTFGFVDYNDPVFVTSCPQVQAGLTGKGIAWALRSGPGGEWYPLAMISHMLDCQLFGLDARWHHLTNLLLHAATAIGLFLGLRSMTGELWPSATRGRDFCRPSAARGERGLGCRATGRLERIVLCARPGGLCRIRSSRASPGAICWWP